jgi:3-oxoadipate enol-lactonase
MDFIKINGLTTHYRYINKKKDKTFVFINSLGTDFRIWDKVVDKVQKHGNVLLYDKRGHGLSETGENSDGMNGYYEDLLALLKALDIKQCIPVGLSVGGRIAMLLAEKQPDLVEKLVLCDTGHIIGTTQNWNDRIQAVDTMGLSKITNAIMERWFPKPFRDKYPTEIEGYKRMITHCSAEGYIHCCEAIRDANLTETAKNISHQTLCLVGSKDLATPPELVESLSKLIKNSKFRVIRGSGHIPCVDNAAILSKYILDFINGK